MEAAPQGEVQVLYGRRGELAAIGQLLEGMRSGRAGVLVLRGEAGIGKTALLDTAAAQAAGARVLRAAGVECEEDLPFAGLHALLRPVLDQLGTLPERQATALRGAVRDGRADRGGPVRGRPCAAELRHRACRGLPGAVPG